MGKGGSEKGNKKGNNSVAKNSGIRILVENIKKLLIFVDQKGNGYDYEMKFGPMSIMYVLLTASSF